MIPSGCRVLFVIVVIKGIFFALSGAIVLQSSVTTPTDVKYRTSRTSLLAMTSQETGVW